MKSKARSTALASAVKIDELSGIRCILIWLPDMTDLCCCRAEEDPCKMLPVSNMLMTFGTVFHVDSGISFTISTRRPYSPILTSE